MFGGGGAQKEESKEVKRAPVGKVSSDPFGQKSKLSESNADLKKSKTENVGKVNSQPFGSVKLKDPVKKDYTGPTFSFEKRSAPRKSSIKADFEKQESILQESTGPGAYHS